MAAVTFVAAVVQVKSLEEQFKRENERLEAELEEVRSKAIHQPVIDIDTPAGAHGPCLCLLAGLCSC
jgi:hypothetical protein